MISITMGADTTTELQEENSLLLLRTAQFQKFYLLFYDVMLGSPVLIASEWLCFYHE
jgi:hypothetical protein